MQKGASFRSFEKARLKMSGEVAWQRAQKVAAPKEEAGTDSAGSRFELSSLGSSCHSMTLSSLTHHVFIEQSSSRQFIKLSLSGEGPGGAAENMHAGAAAPAAAARLDEGCCESSIHGTICEELGASAAAPRAEAQPRCYRGQAQHCGTGAAAQGIQCREGAERACVAAVAQAAAPGTCPCVLWKQNVCGISIYWCMRPFDGKKLSMHAWRQPKLTLNMRTQWPEPQLQGGAHTGVQELHALLEHAASEVKAIHDVAHTHIHKSALPGASIYALASTGAQLSAFHPFLLSRRKQACAPSATQHTPGTMIAGACGLACCLPLKPHPEPHPETSPSELIGISIVVSDVSAVQQTNVCC
eukprot:1159931-Pelagomonas_calceolata.AAC.14